MRIFMTGKYSAIFTMSRYPNMDKQIVVHPDNSAVLLSTNYLNRKNLDESNGHYAGVKKKKTDIKVYLLYYFIYMNF